MPQWVQECLAIVLSAGLSQGRAVLEEPSRWGTDDLYPQRVLCPGLREGQVPLTLVCDKEL